MKRFLFADEPPTLPWAGIRKFAIDNPAVSITVFYALLVCIGLIYNGSLFARFGINILDYAEKEDFFFAGVKNPGAISYGLSLSLLLLVYRRFANRAKKLRSRVLRFISLYFTWIGLLRAEILMVLAASYFLFGFHLAAKLEADKLLRGSGNQWTAFIQTKEGNPTKHEIIPIGATKNYIFGIECSPKLLAAQASGNMERFSPTVKALPFSQILSIEYRTVERANQGTVLLSPGKDEAVAVGGATGKPTARDQE